MSVLSYVARRFVAGEDMHAALEAVGSLNDSNFVASLDFLGENVSSLEEAEKAALEYVQLLEAISKRNVRSNVSLKISQMGIDVDANACKEVVKKIMEHAKGLNNFVRIDMESSIYTERTLQLFYDLLPDYPNVGIVIQSMLHRSEKDAERLASFKAPVRVCKGAYKESDAIAYQRMEDIRRSFKNLVEILLKGGSEVGIATHDESLIQWALEWTKQENIPKAQFEFQMLYGLRRSKGKELLEQGYSVRSYVPYGTHWFPYFVRRLRERKENVLFVLRSLIAD